jgi:hypothetical protein
MNIENFLTSISPLDEQWLPVEATGYWISNHGRVVSQAREYFTGQNRCAKRITRHTLLRLQPCPKGYLRFKLCRNGNQSTVKVHRLVAEYFVKNLDPVQFEQVNHKDGIKTNNHYSNLEWVNASSNQKHAHSLGLYDRKGENNSSAKLTEQQVKELKQEFKIKNYRGQLAALARQYKIHENTLARIRDNKLWKHIVV